MVAESSTKHSDKGRDKGPVLNENLSTVLKCYPPDYSFKMRLNAKHLLKSLDFLTSKFTDSMKNVTCICTNLMVVNLN